MVKIVIFFRRKAGMSPKAFHEHWRTTHADLIVRLPGLRGYVQSHALHAGAIAGEPLYDGVAESWFDDTQAMRTLAKTPEYAAVLADEPNFIDRASMGSIIAEEHCVKDGSVSADAIKRIDFLRRRPEVSIDDFQRDGRDVLGRSLAHLPAVQRCVQSYTRRSAYENGRTPAYDGAAMTWFDNVTAARSLDTSSELGSWRADRANLLDKTPPDFVLSREHVIAAPPSQ